MVWSFSKKLEPDSTKKLLKIIGKFVFIHSVKFVMITLAHMSIVRNDKLRTRDHPNIIYASRINDNNNRNMIEKRICDLEKVWPPIAEPEADFIAKQLISIIAYCSRNNASTYLSRNYRDKMDVSSKIINRVIQGLSETKWFNKIHLHLPALMSELRTNYGNANNYIIQEYSLQESNGNVIYYIQYTVCDHQLNPCQTCIQNSTLKANDLCEFTKRLYCR